MSAVLTPQPVCFDRIAAHRKARAEKQSAITKLGRDIERLATTEADVILLTRRLGVAANNAKLTQIADGLDALCDEVTGNDSDSDCADCAGTGEGQYDTACSSCRGKGFFGSGK